MTRDPCRRRRLVESPADYARRRYKAARSRALYWSGNPTLTGRRYTPGRRANLVDDLMYEMAIDDCRRWEAELASLGHAPATPYDPHRLINQRWSKLNSSIRRRANRPAAARLPNADAAT